MYTNTDSVCSLVETSNGYPT